MVEKGDPEPVLTIPSLDIHGIHFDLRERKVSIATIAMANATDRVWRNSDESINVQSFFAPVKHDSSTVPTVLLPA